METYQKGGITINYYGECFEKSDECIKGFSEPFRKKKNQAYPQVFHDKHHSVVIIFTTDLTNLTDCVLLGARQKPEKPLERMEGNALMSCFRSGLIRVSS